ncbi:leucine-rich repeat-containing protein 49-like [Amphibalanus amphitrite]|uniref:leucine-rich repeat-containing protein 49-like n=1 Tax=Amphibalanus amphitrite TaxID=1232801 RepID=UPI001C918908|nr:leucine-rich repeat-containing protein 49-like [Amphibalanus amphitrite]
MAGATVDGRGGGARGRPIALVGAVDSSETGSSSDAAGQRGPADQPDSAAAAAEKQKRIKISFDGLTDRTSPLLGRPFPSALLSQGLFAWPESVDKAVNLLTLQSNFISRLPDGLYLPALVLLDLYDNQLERLGGLRHLETLRVLVVARNRLRKIEGLEQLVHLEILDLHSNYITRTTGLETLSRLRVLNLANNCVRTVGGLASLGSLQQLNLRGNSLRRLVGLEQLPRLVKLNLAHNDIRRSVKEPDSRHVIQKYKTQKDPGHRIKTRTHRQTDPGHGKMADVECLVNCHQLEELSLNSAPVAAHPGYHPLLYRLKRLKLLDGMHTELEIKDGCLIVSGDRALRLLATWEPRDAGQVRCLAFSRLEFDQLAPLLVTLRDRFPQAAALRLGAVRLSTLSQLNAVSRLGELRQLTVEPAGNPVTQQRLWRPYAVYRLHHRGLRRINDTAVSGEEAAAAAAQFGPLGRLAFCCLPESRLVEIAERLWFSDVKTKNGDTRPTVEQVRSRLADPRLQGVMEREALLYSPRRTAGPCSPLEAPLREAQRSVAALRTFHGLLPSLLRELSGSAHQRRAGSAAAGHETRALLDQLAASIDGPSS